MQPDLNSVKQSPGKSSGTSTEKEPDIGITLASWRDWEAIAREESAEEIRRLVDAVFREEVMGGLALLLVPILLLADFTTLPPTISSFLTLCDVGIWVFFILEYICRLAVAPDRGKFIMSPWYLLDLVIISVPAVALFAGIGYGISRYLRVLRALQAIQILAFGGKTVRRHLAAQAPHPGEERKPAGMRIRSLPLATAGGTALRPAQGPGWSPVTIADRTGAGDCSGLWLDVSGWSGSDLPVISRLSQIPAYLLEEKLRERAYPRADVSGTAGSFFLKIPGVIHDPRDRRKWRISWKGLLILCEPDAVMTFSRSALPVLDRVPSMAFSEQVPVTGLGIVYLVVRDALGTVEDFILTGEDQLMYLEAQPMDRLPPNFLTMMYSIRKELSRINSWLLHTKAVLDGAGSGDEERDRLQSLIDRCSALSDNAQNVSDSLARMVDFYLNTTSFQMNRVMKILAVLTALTMVPTLVGGLLGMNLVGNPWPVTLLQMVTAVALIMLLTAWVYFNLGWLRK
jgi:Mg2+ and Co2+ transporter CorA